jgi:hypothetical protein
VLAAIGKRRGLTYVKRDDNPDSHTFVTPSTWVALNRDAGVIAALGKAAPDAPWSPLLPPAERIWSDDHASILPFMRWENMFKTP